MGFSLLVLLTAIATAVAFPINNENHLVMPHDPVTDSDACLSWRWAVETYNIRYFSNAVPSECSDYLYNYMVGSQFRRDIKLVCDEAYNYAKGVNLTGDGMDLWVFDVDDTTLSTLPYFLEQGSWELNVHSSYGEWTRKGESPVIPEALNLYKKLIKLGFKIVFISGMHDEYSECGTKNLKEAGYTEWEKVIFRGREKISIAEFKSNKRKELEEGGYKIWGNIGDQWADITGTNVGDRTFKIPNPMYYVP